MLTIGFATEYYTLWDVRKEIVYFTDAYGNHHPQNEVTHYSYIRNVSKDMGTATAAHPGVPVDETLRGQTRSFECRSAEDLTPELLKFGKYQGLTIQDVAKKDFGYILWLLENGRPYLVELCKALPEVIAHFQEVERNRAAAMDALPVIESGINEITFLGNPNYTVRDSYPQFAALGLDDKYYAAATIGEGSTIIVVFDDVKYVDGMYPYNMPFIGGKAKRVKGKTMSLPLNVLATTKTLRSAIQIVRIAF